MGGFGMFFGGGQKNQIPTGPTASFNLRLTLEQLYSGTVVDTEITRRVICRGCKKVSDKNREKCSRCGACPHETKTVERQMGGFLVQQEVEVPSKEKCRKEVTPLKVEVERGSSSGDTIVFPRMSDQSPGQIPGDVVFRVTQLDHELYRREGNDLKATITISLKEALTGFRHEFLHVDGKNVAVETNPVSEASDIIHPGSVKVLQGKGMPLKNTPSITGNLYVGFHIEFPTTISGDQNMKLSQVL